jgi:hypothetical protein
MSKAVRFDPKEWPSATVPEEELIYEPTKDDVRGKRDHKHGHDRDKDKKDKKYENWN